MQIHETANKRIKIHNSKNNLDKPLARKGTIPEPLPNYSGFQMLILGSAGSGKTTFLTSILNDYYKQVFQKIIIVSPTLGSGESQKDDIFADHPRERVFDDLNESNMDDILEQVDEARKNKENTLLLLDDVSTDLKRSKYIERKLGMLSKNRRHKFLSIVCIMQKWKDSPTGFRCNCSHFVCFDLQNGMERQSFCDEVFTLGKKKADAVWNHVFESNEPHTFLYIDKSRRLAHKSLYFKKFNQLDFS